MSPFPTHVRCTSPNGEDGDPLVDHYLWFVALRRMGRTMTWRGGGVFSSLVAADTGGGGISREGAAERTQVILQAGGVSNPDVQSSQNSPQSGKVDNDHLALCIRNANDNARIRINTSIGDFVQRAPFSFHVYGGVGVEGDG